MPFYSHLDPSFICSMWRVMLIKGLFFFFITKQKTLNANNAITLTIIFIYVLLDSRDQEKNWE